MKEPLPSQQPTKGMNLTRGYFGQFVVNLDTCVIGASYPTIECTLLLQVSRTQGLLCADPSPLHAGELFCLTAELIPSCRAWLLWLRSIVFSFLFVLC